ncbi:MAG: hypothetical protein QGG71_09005 [Pirellulaceae bacterium]|nr:hypothetical protein [Pirellulaceae bacterium]
MSFDPYHQWLGIPTAEQPPNHYRLLGVAIFESDPDVISNAADRQMTHVKTFQMGQHVADSQRLLSEIVAARGCLLQVESRATYDLQLRLQSAGPTKPTPSETQSDKPEATAAVSTGRRPHNQSRKPVLVVSAMAVVVVLVSAGIFMRHGDQDVNKHSVQVSEATATKGSELPVKEASSQTQEPPESAVNTSVVPESKNSSELITPQDPSSPSVDVGDVVVETTNTSPQSRGDAESVIATTPEPTTAKTTSPEPATGGPTTAETVTPDIAAQPLTPFDLPGRLPVPDKADLAAAKALVKELYQPEYEQAETLEQKAAVARKLLVAAQDPGNDANGRYAMLGVARIMAVQAGDADTAMRAIDILDRHFEVDALVLKQAALQAWAKMPMAKERRAELAKRIPPIAEEAVQQERYDIASSLLQLARDTARRAGTVPLAKEMATRLKEIDGIAIKFAGVQKALEVLAVDSSDEEANNVVGRYYCLERGDWNRGLPLLARSGKARLQAFAERDLSGANPGAEQLGLGDMWWELAQQEEPGVAVQLLVRAHHWYAIAAPNLSGLAKTKCEKRLAEATVAMGGVKGGRTTSNANSGTGLEFDGTAWIETDLKYDGKTPLTIETWITPTADRLQSIVANCHGVGLSLQVGEDGKWGFFVRDNKTYQGADSNDKVRLGQRVHIVGVFDGRIVRLFVNGRLQDAVGTMTSAHKVANFRFMIGADPDFNSRPQKHFQGSIDSVHVSLAVLYQKNFTPRDPPLRTPATVLLLKLDEGEGDEAKDSSRQQRHARIHDAKWKKSASRSSPVASPNS